MAEMNLSAGANRAFAGSSAAKSPLPPPPPKSLPRRPHKSRSPEKPAEKYKSVMEEEDMARLNSIKDILNVEEKMRPEFSLAKNQARFERKLAWYQAKKEWLNIAPVQKISRLFKQQTKELEFIRARKMDYEMELETASLTPSQRSCRKDELKMRRAHEKMAIQLISKIQAKCAQAKSEQAKIQFRSK